MPHDVDAQHRHQRGVVDDLRRGLNIQEQELRTARARLESCKQASVRHEKRLNEQQIAMQKAEDYVEELKEALEKENVEDGHLDVLRETLKDAEEERSVNEGSYNDSSEAMQAMMNTLKESRRELKEKDAQISRLLEELRVAESEQHTVQDKRRQILSSKNAVIQRIDEAKQSKERIHREREEVVERVLDYNEKASLVSPRVAVDEGETTRSLDNKLERLHRDLRRYNQE